jgi:hypothetical protein
MENLNVNQEMNFEEMADVVGGLTRGECGDLLNFVGTLVDDAINSVGTSNFETAFQTAKYGLAVYDSVCS